MFQASLGYMKLLLKKQNAMNETHCPCSWAAPQATQASALIPLISQALLVPLPQLSALIPQKAPVLHAPLPPCFSSAFLTLITASV